MLQNQSALPTNFNTNKLCQQYINVLYHNVPGHGVNIRQNKNKAEIYGEILYQSIDTLLSQISLSTQDIFFDLGSGLGKAAIQVFLNSDVKEVCGIEIIPELHQQSLIATEKVQQDLSDFYPNRQLTFLLGSFLEIPFTNASVVLIGSPCFSQKILYPLGKIIDSIASIHTVLTLRPICTLERLSFIKAVRVECSWDTALCYIYKRKRV
ncbi:MAG TPA: hypothetical protein VHZ76_05815 [Gammaproteobacteria bacterium]|nr:hypothetical protein [Gammaproteobacteria bacterium]